MAKPSKIEISTNATNYLITVVSAINNFIDLGSNISANAKIRLEYAQALNANNTLEANVKKGELIRSNELVI